MQISFFLYVIYKCKVTWLLRDLHPFPHEISFHQCMIVILYISCFFPSVILHSQTLDVVQKPNYIYILNNIQRPQQQVHLRENWWKLEWLPCALEADQLVIQIEKCWEGCMYRTRVYKSALFKAKRPIFVFN